MWKLQNRNFFFNVKSTPQLSMGPMVHVRNLIKVSTHGRGRYGLNSKVCSMVFHMHLQYSNKNIVLYIDIKIWPREVRPAWGMVFIIAYKSQLVSIVHLNVLDNTLQYWKRRALVCTIFTLKWLTIAKELNGTMHLVDISL